jgi:hypothetical protein
MVGKENRRLGIAMLDKVATGLVDDNGDDRVCWFEQAQRFKITKECFMLPPEPPP